MRYFDSFLPQRLEVTKSAALCCALLTGQSFAETSIGLDAYDSRSVVFSFRAHASGVVPDRRSKPHDFFHQQNPLEQQAALTHDEELEFHTLWMRQYDDDYRRAEGGAALGRILRMSAQRWYKNYRSNNRDSSLPDAYGRGSVSNDVDYRLKVSDDRIRLGIKYEF